MRTSIVATIFLALLFAATGCEKEAREFYTGYGKKPVYVSPDDLLDIGNEPPRPIGLSGTIYLRDTLLFVLEQGQGIHVFSLADTSNTVNLAFFRIPAITDFTVAGTVLYADSWRDLVAVDISDLQHIVETDRLTGVISPTLYPPLYEGIFECVDESKGAVVAWQDTTLEHARCATTN
jgi:hypothetical protein